MDSPDRIEEIILQNILHNATFSRSILPYMKKEYFEEFTEKELYTQISDFIMKYDATPSKEAILISVDNCK